MAIPTYAFEDETAGLPRQAIPVRFACLAADWSPALFASIVAGYDDWPPGLTVYEFDSGAKRVGQVHPAFYEALGTLKGPLKETLAALPGNHFVWSDELVSAFRNYIDDTIGRDSAWGTGLAIRWNPALAETASAIDACVDLSEVRGSGEATYSIKRVNEVWLIRFEGSERPYKDQRGLHYLRYLLARPAYPYSVSQLFLVVNPPPAEHIETGAEASLSEELRNPDSGITETTSTEATGDVHIDKAGLKLLRKAIATTKEDLEVARETSNLEKTEELEDKLETLTKALFARTNNRGQPRAVAGDTERMRKAVSLAIKRTIDDIETQDHSLAEHLRNSIKMGGTFEYTPPQPYRRWLFRH